MGACRVSEPTANGEDASWRRKRPITAWALASAALIGLAAGTGATDLDFVGPRLLLPDRPGPALRLAFEALDAEDAVVAAVRFDAIEAAFPIVADYAAEGALTALNLAGDSAAARAGTQRFAERYPDSILFPDVLERGGDAAEAAGEEISARKQWRRAQKRTGGRARRAALEAKIAASYERSGNTAKAIESYRKLWTRDAARPEGRTADAALDRLEADAGKSLRSARNWIDRGEALYRARDNEGALAAFDHALTRGLRRDVDRDVRWKRARTLFRLRRYPEATNAFQAMGKGIEARFWHARALARSRRIEESIAAFERLAKGRTTPLAFRARYLAATLLQGEGAHTRARAHFKAVAASSSGLRFDARWRLGWMAFLDDDLVTARDHFAELARTDPDPVGALRPRYWLAKAQIALGDTSGEEVLLAMAREFPFTYYGWRAGTSLRDASLEREAPELPQSSPSKMNRRALTRARILLEAGRPEFAAREVRQAARSGLSLDDRVVAAGLLTAAQKIHRAQRAVANGYAVELARGPVPGREAIWWYAWPRSFLAADWTPLASRVPEGLALAVMREESGYRPKVVSPVGARGLMQIMPETGRRLARSVGRDDFHPDHLFEPEVNVALGRHYLGQLLEQFDGRASAAIASYNAGPEVVSKWVAQRSDWPDDRWVEAIPYSETRSYVRRVLRSLHIYRVLYGPEGEPQAPVTTDSGAAAVSSNRNDS